MSTSASNPVLTVRGDPDAELFVIGGDLRTVAYGVQAINQALPAGLYKVRAVRGGTTKERLVELAGTPVEVGMWIDAFDAIAPIGPVFGHQATAIETVARKAAAAGAKCAPLAEAEAKAGLSGLLVLGHMKAADEGGDPLADMRLFPWRQIAARQALDCDVVPRRVGDEIWRGWFRRCAPGCHVLELHDGSQWVRQALFVAPGWETRVFVRRGAGNTGDGQAPVPPEISIQMAPPGHPVVYEDHYQSVEVARRALEASRPIMVSDELVEQLLWGKWDNPVMGITGLHLFLEALERRDGIESAEKRRVDLSGVHVNNGPEIVREVLGNLHKLLRGGGQRSPHSVTPEDLTGPVPADLAGLETRAARFLDAPPQVPLPIVDHPPMFWASWVALRDAQANGARYDVQHRLWTDTANSIAAGPYFSWQPKRVSLSSYVNNAIEAAVMVPSVVSALGAVSSHMAIMGTAAALLASRGGKASRVRTDHPELDETRADIGKALGIPESVIKGF